MNKDLFTAAKVAKPSKIQQPDTSMAAPQAPPQGRVAAVGRAGLGKMGHDRRTVVTPAREKVIEWGYQESGTPYNW